ncbi:MAG: acyl carrier protein [Bacillota bacterium]|jgi:acyl carrier protein|nr:acyl carrier protein [Bacillota bacterium]HOK70213.1 acyl carrier protein [Bacillota bacterium]HOL52333.1 acyl carrier protein [Bacillota bacterium]HOO29749.1 acyl carrier protein [Bacillota bacterium]HPQ02172.1 acyl carrier protein [Bacillota bacterium]
MTLDELKAIISDQLEVSPEEISTGTRFVQDLGADSLDMVELIMSIEEKLGVRIEQQEVKDMVTVGDVVSYIEAHKQAVK